MYTRCPECHTCFRVTDRHLEIANGKVRCGQCQHIFMAPEHAVDDIPLNNLAAATHAPPPVTSQAQSVVAQQATPVKKQTEIVEKPLVAEVAPKPVPPPPQAKPITTPEMTPEITPDLLNKEPEEERPEEVEFIQLDPETPEVSKAQNKNEQDIDGSLTQEIDLDAAINLLNDDEEDENTETFSFNEPVEPEPEKNLVEEKSVYDTDTPEKLSAKSVSDVMDEVQGQLSLNIDEAKDEKEYNADEEFEFIELADEEISFAAPEASTTVDEESIQDEVIDVNQVDARDNPQEVIDEDELFDEIDISDLDEPVIKEEVQLEKKVEEEFEDEFSGFDDVDDAPKTSVTDIPYQLRNDVDRLEAGTNRIFHPAVLLVVLILLLIGSFSQVAYFRSHDLLASIPATRPLLENFCEKVTCQYSGPRDLKQVQLISRNVRKHPKEKSALMITAAMVNQAKYAQPYPDIHIKLSDISGNVVAERIFNAKTYMGKLSNPFLLMKPSTPVYINFEVVDPGKDAVNFEFSFR